MEGGKGATVEEEKEGGRIKEKRESRTGELDSSLALGPWPLGKKVHLSFAKCTPCFVLIQDNRLWLFSIVEQYFRKYLESVIITALQNKLLSRGIYSFSLKLKRERERLFFVILIFIYQLTIK